MHKTSTLYAVGRIVYSWMLDHGYMVDDETGEVVADQVYPADAEDLLQRLEADGWDLRDRQQDSAA